MALAIPFGPGGVLAGLFGYERNMFGRTLLYLLLCWSACWAQDQALLLVVESRDSQSLKQLNQQLSGYITQTGQPLARPLIYTFQKPSHQRYCEGTLGVRREQLPLLGLARVDRYLRVTSLTAVHPNIDRNPDGMRLAVEEWSGERLTAAAPTNFPGRPAGPPGRLEIESIRAQRGGPPFHVLNIRVTLRNAGSTPVESLSMAVYAREAGADDWRLIREWPRLSRLQPGYRVSRDHIGKSNEIASPDFRVKVVVTTPDGTLQKEAGPAGEDEPW